MLSVRWAASMMAFCLLLPSMMGFFLDRGCHWRGHGHGHDCMRCRECSVWKQDVPCLLLTFKLKLSTLLLVALLLPRVSAVLQPVALEVGCGPGDRLARGRAAGYQAGYRGRWVDSVVFSMGAARYRCWQEQTCVVTFLLLH